MCICLLYTSDAADDSLRVDLGGRRIIKKKLGIKDGPILGELLQYLSKELAYRDWIILMKLFIKQSDGLNKMRQNVIKYT